MPLPEEPAEKLLSAEEEVAASVLSSSLLSPPQGVMWLPGSTSVDTPARTEVQWRMAA